MRILIAEDDLVSRKFLFRFLSIYGECDLVVDGLETLDAFLMSVKENTPYDLICLDVMMPKLDGMTVLNAIRDFEKQKGILPDKRVKVIMTTALTESRFEQDAFKRGCDAYTTKPINTGKFLDVLREHGLIH